MSASREKKQRQGSGAPEPVTEAQLKAAAYKKKVRCYTAIGIVVVALVAALLIWDSGLFQRGQTAVTVGDTNYTVTDLSYYYQNVRYQNFFYYYYLGSTPPSDDTIRDEESGQTYREYFLEEAMSSMTELTALYDAAIADGYTDSSVADTVQEQIDSAKSAATTNGYSYAAYLRAQYGRYMTAGAFKSIVTKAAVASAYASDHSDSLTYTDADLQAYYDENKDSLDSYTYSYLYFTPEAVPTTDDDGNTIERTEEETETLEAEALAAAKEKADAALAALTSGADVASLIEEYELTSSNSADHTTVVGSSVTSTISETLFTLSNGDTTLVENGESGYYALVLHERTLVEDPTVDVRHILIRAETGEDEEGNTVAPTDEAWAAAKEKADAVLAEYQAGEQTEDAFAALVETYSEDTGSNTTGGLYTAISPTSGYVEEFLGWIFDEGHAAGDVGVIQHAGDVSSSSAYWGYHVMYYVGGNAPVWANTAESALRNADTTEWVEGLQEGYTAALAGGADYV